MPVTRVGRPPPWRVMRRRDEIFRVPYAEWQAIIALPTASAAGSRHHFAEYRNVHARTALDCVFDD